MSEADSPAVQDPRTREVDYQTKRAELRKAIAEANKAHRDSVVPAFPTELPSGSLDAGEGGSPVGVLAAYRALDGAARQIVQIVDNLKDVKSIWVVPHSLIGKYEAIHGLVDRQLERLAVSLEEASKVLLPPDTEPKPKPAAFPAALLLSLAASALPTVMHFMKSDIILRHHDVAIPFATLASVLGGQLSKPSRSVFISGVSRTVDSELHTRADTIAKAREELRRKLLMYRAQMEVGYPDRATANEKLTALKTILDGQASKDAPGDFEQMVGKIVLAAGEAGNLTRDLAQMEARVSFVEETIDAVDQVLGQMTTTNDDGLTALSIAANYAAHASGHILIVDPPSPGVSRRTNK